MKKLTLAILMLIVLAGCKKKNQEIEPEYPSVISGKLYGAPFEAKITLERMTEFSMNEYTPQTLFAIYVSAEADKSCSSANSAFAIRLTAPKKIGTFSGNDTYILTQDLRNGVRERGSLFSSEQTIIKIINFDDTQVSGTVEIKDEESKTDLKGRFTAAVCR